MKAKITSTKIRFLMLCLTVLISVMGISFSASAEGCAHPNLKEDNWEITRKTTCKKEGERSQWCYDCGSEVKETLPFDANAHVKDTWTIITPHSCQSDGYQVAYCYYGCVYGPGENEGKKIILEEKTIPAHDYRTIYIEEATCQEAGYKFVACVTCYDAKSEDIPVDTKNGHRYTPWYVSKANTCNEKSERSRKCLFCGEVDSEEYFDTENHLKIEWDEKNKVAATCMAPGYIPGVCTGCDKEFKDIIPQHTNSPYKKISEIPSTCSTHGTQRRLCECGFEYDFELPLVAEAHVYSEWQIEKEPSCTKGSRYKFCIYHYDAKIPQDIPATGNHNYGEWKQVIEPDCSKTGLEERICTDCAEGTAGHRETRILPTKHDFRTWIAEDEVKISCDESELVEGRKHAFCENCMYDKWFVIPAVHSFSEWRIVTKADCRKGTPGIMERTCSGCKKVETKEYNAEHDFTDWYVTGEPACKKDIIVDGVVTGSTTGRTGTYTRWCNTCRTTEHKAIGVNHEFVEVSIDTYPTCQSKENGKLIAGSKTLKCKFCDETKAVDFYGEHNYGEWVVNEEECEKSRTCVCCGYVNTEEVHDYVWYYNKVKVECGTKFNGFVELEKYCTRCKVLSDDKKLVSEIAHSYIITVVTEPTCTTSGYTVEYCPDCKVENVIDIIPANGHNLDEYWSSKNEATCNTEGSRYKACADCDYIEYQKVARTEHTLIELSAGRAPTCVESGYTAETFCTGCREIFFSEEIAPLGHSISEDTGLCSVCKVYDGYECACDCHSSSGLQKIVFSIINKLYQLFGINQECGCGALHYDEPGFFAKLFSSDKEA